MISKISRKKKMIQTKDVSVLLEGWDEKMKRFFRYIGAQFIRGEGGGEQKYLELFHSPSQINCDVDVVV